MKDDDQLDAVDRRIVRELQRDASLSHAALAERVGASAASVWRRVRALEAGGVLGKSVRLASAEKLGRAVNVLCQVRMTRQSVQARADFEAFIGSREEIVECYSMSGEGDDLLRVGDAAGACGTGGLRSVHRIARGDRGVLFDVG